MTRSIQATNSGSDSSSFKKGMITDKSNVYFFVNVLKINDENKDESRPLMLYAKMVFIIKKVRLLTGSSFGEKTKNKMPLPMITMTRIVASVFRQCVSESINEIAV